MSPCNCIAVVNEKLKVEGYKLRLRFSNELRALTSVETARIDGKRGRNSIALFAPFCPFCGVKHEQGAPDKQEPDSQPSNAGWKTCTKPSDNLASISRSHRLNLAPQARGFFVP